MDKAECWAMLGELREQLLAGLPPAGREAAEAWRVERERVAARDEVVAAERDRRVAAWGVPLVELADVAWFFDGGRAAGGVAGEGAPGSG